MGEHSILLCLFYTVCAFDCCYDVFIVYMVYDILAVHNVQVNTERAIRHVIQERLPIVVVINKVILLTSEHLSVFCFIHCF